MTTVTATTVQSAGPVNFLRAQELLGVAAQGLGLKGHFWHFVANVNDHFEDTILYYTTLYYTMLYYAILHYTTLILCYKDIGVFCVAFFVLSAVTYIV